MSTSSTTDGAATMAAAPSTLAPGPATLDRHLIAGRYRIESVIGTGGMAAVYRAQDETLGRAVAVKVIAPVADDPSAVKRERTEVELLASLNHRALVTLFDAGVEPIVGVERTYLVMELVEGSTLADELARAPISPADVCAMAIDLAEALHVVHHHGVVHRDIKPGNVLVTPSHLPGRDFTVKLADFGIAYLIDATRLTVAGGLVGTAAYLSPEQAQGHPPAPSSDIYSLGLVLLEALTGERSFPGTLLASVSARLVTDPAVPETLGHGWADLLTRMTARTPDDRPTALDVALAARAIELDDRTTTVMETVPRALGPEAAGRLRSRPGREPSEPGRTRRRTLGVVVCILVLLVVALLVGNLATAGGSAPPLLPPVDEPLGTDLDELLQSVTP